MLKYTVDTPNKDTFKKFNKLPRYNTLGCSITEKIDGTNASIVITEDGKFFTQSRNYFITPNADNYGFSTWAHENKDELISALGTGTHFGEWWGRKIGNRCYGLQERRFSLFNVARWKTHRKLPNGVHVVPTLFTGDLTTNNIENTMSELRATGSIASKGFMNPEGIVIYLPYVNGLLKHTFEYKKGKWGNK